MMTFSADANGKFSLGTLSEGVYTLTFSFKTSAVAKTFYESGSNTVRAVVINGTKDGSVAAVWDARQNQLYELNYSALRLVQRITCEVVGVQEVTGQVTGFTAPRREPGQIVN